VKIFIRGLPAETSPISLQAFAENLLSPHWYQPFRQKLSIKNCMVLKIRDLDLHTIEFHGLLEVAPFKAAQKAIERINGQSFQGRRVMARKWVDRTERDEWRDDKKDGVYLSEVERMERERRRPNLRIETYVPPDFRGLRQFHRQFD